MKKWKLGLCLVLAAIMICGNAFAAVNLKKGSRSWDVLFAEDRLSYLGFNPGTTDGVFDEDTTNAVKAFQKDRGLKETGTIKDETWDALFDEQYSLVYSMGIGNRDYRIHGKMPSRFAKMEIRGSSSKQDKNEAVFTDPSGNILLDAILFVGDESMDEAVQNGRKIQHDLFEQTFVTSYNGKNYKEGKVKDSTIRGKSAKSWLTTWSFTNGGELTRYFYYSVMELDSVGTHQAYAIISMIYNIDKSMKAMDKSLGSSAMKEALENIRCDRDRLYEYQAGAAKRMKASKLKKFAIPEVQPVDETEQGALDIIYEIWHYVNPEADGTQGEMTGETCVSMYYGVKIMDRYMYLVNTINGRENARMECIMSLANSAFYDDFREARPEIRDKLAAAMSAAKLALNKENKAYLTALGLAEPTWTAEDLEIMTQSLVGAMDRVIESSGNNETGTKTQEQAEPEEAAQATGTPEPVPHGEEKPSQEEETWICPTCGEECTTNFCVNCGSPSPTPKPAEESSAEGGTWICPTCGEKCTYNYCTNCGSPRPAQQTAETSASEAPKQAETSVANKNEGILRFDGTYLRVNEKSKAWLRFFPEGTVTSGSTALEADAEGAFIWLHDPPFELGVSSGEYTIDGDHIEFDIETDRGVITFSGKIQDSECLILDVESHINGRTFQGEVYSFAPARGAE